MPAISSEALHWIPRVIKDYGSIRWGWRSETTEVYVGGDEKNTEATVGVECRGFRVLGHGKEA